MRYINTLILSIALIASSARAGLITSILPWADGNTLLLSVTTDAAGDVLTQTISTLTEGVTGADTVATTSPTTTGRTRTTTTAKTTAATTDGPDTTGQRVVGEETSNAPMHTTTYWYDPGSGTWTSAVWTASVTSDPTIATAIVPEGTVQDYQQYQQSANSVILSSAIASQGDSGTGVSAGMERWSSAAAGWTAMGVGMIGAMWAVIAM